MPYKTQKLISQSELTLLTGVTSTMRQHKQEKGGGFVVALLVHPFGRRFKKLWA